MAPIPTPLPKTEFLNKISKKMTDGNAKSNSKSQILITVTVSGSPGPIRLLVNKKEPIGFVIRNVLKVYHRQGRLPVLGHDVDKFYLYRENAGGALDSSELIGSTECRNFLMCKKPIEDQTVDENIGRKGSLKTWLNKSLNLTVIGMFFLSMLKIVFIRSIHLY